MHWIEFAAVFAWVAVGVIVAMRLGIEVHRR